MPRGQLRVGGDGVQDPRRRGAIGAFLEDPGLDVQRLGRHLQAVRKLLQDLGAGPLEPPLDLRQVRVGDPGELRQLPKRQAGRHALFTQVPPQISNQSRCHPSSMLAAVSTMQTEGSVSLVT